MSLPPIRMGMSVADGAVFADEVMHRDGDPVLRDAYTEQLWLLSVFVEQRRRTTIAMRPEYDERANRVLALLDP